MAETSGPFATGTFSTMNDGVWREFVKTWIATGVHPTLLNKLACTPGSGLNINVDTGYAVVEGCYYKNDSMLAKSIAANASGNPRIDRIVLRLDNTGKVCALQVLQGTPASSPSAPSLTQTTTTWEMPLYQVAVANGAGSFTSGNLTDERQYGGAWAMYPAGMGPGSGLNADQIDGFNSSSFVQGSSASQHIIVLNRAPTSGDGVDGDIILQW